MSTKGWLLLGIAALIVLGFMAFLLLGGRPKPANDLDRRVNVCVVDQTAPNHGEIITVDENEAQHYGSPNDPACSPTATPWSPVTPPR